MEPTKIFKVWFPLAHAHMVFLPDMLSVPETNEPTCKQISTCLVDFAPESTKMKVFGRELYKLRNKDKVYLLVVLLLGNTFGLCVHAEAYLAGSTGTSTDSDTDRRGMFESWTDMWLDEVDTNQRNYGVAVADVDFDGNFEVIVAGFTGPNLVLKYDKNLGVLSDIVVPGSPYESLADPKGQAIGLCACDIDGDGREEIYILNTNHAYAGVARYSDKLFKWRDGKYVDLFTDPINMNISAKDFSGRSVACLDRYGRGKYSFAVATYSDDGVGKFAVIEMEEFHNGNNIEEGRIVLQNVAKEARIDRSTGGRGLVVGPILNDDGLQDIFFGNEGNSWLGNNGHNFLFKNFGNGTFVEVSTHHGLADEAEAGRGVALADLNHDGLLDIIYGNADGPNRLFLQQISNDARMFIDKATPEFSKPGSIRTLIAADFDNDGNTEILLHYINDHQQQQPNKLFRIMSYGPGNDPGISSIDIGDALEPDGYGTGGAYLDINGDGFLDLILSHGEDYAQPLDVYQVNKDYRKSNNAWLRVFPRTKFGAPARGATVWIETNEGDQQLQVIDNGSGYLCQMEPVAHFGLGSGWVTFVEVQWPDGKIQQRLLEAQDMSQVLLVDHPDFENYQKAQKASNLTVAIKPSEAHNHTEL